MDSELLTITEPEVSFRKRGFRSVGEGFLCGELCFLDRDCATALPIAPTLTTAIPMATAIPMTNCVMLLGMIASIHECDGTEIKSRRPLRM